MTEPVVIIAEKREDGYFLLTSPNQPMYVMIAPNETQIVSVGLPILLEMIEANKPENVAKRLAARQ